jgi:hypothetical protein
MTHLSRTGLMRSRARMENYGKEIYATKEQPAQ